MKDVLLWSKGEVPKPGSRRIGIHTSTAGGVQQAAERAYRLGANTFQIFSSSPRQWKPYVLGKPQCDQMRRLREKYGIAPMAIHSSYLVNLASSTIEFHRKSVQAFRGELERAVALCAEFLVLHPGSFRGRSREEGLALVAASIAEAAQGLDLAKSNVRVLIENTAGAEFSLGGSFDQVAQLLEYLQPVCPVGACIDTCHIHVAAYDILSEEGARSFLELCPQSEYVNVTGAAHMVAGDRNDVFADAVIAFLARAVPVRGEPVQLAHETHPRRDEDSGDIVDVP